MEVKYEEKPKFAVDGTIKRSVQQTIKLYTGNYNGTSLKFLRSPNKDVSPKNQTLRGPGGKYVSASQREKQKAEGTTRTTSASKPKVRKVESDEDNSDFECYIKSDGKQVHVDIDKRSHRRRTGTRNTTEKIGRR